MYVCVWIIFNIKLVLKNVYILSGAWPSLSDESYYQLIQNNMQYLYTLYLQYILADTTDTDLVCISW